MPATKAEAQAALSDIVQRLSIVTDYVASSTEAAPAPPPVVTPPPPAEPPPVVTPPPPVVTPPPPSGGGTVPATPIDRSFFPDPPLPPVGPFTKRAPFKVDAPQASLVLKHLEFDGDYTAVAINAQVDTLEMSDCIGNNTGSFIYTAAGAGSLLRATIERVKGANQRKGRPAFRLYGGPAEEFVTNDIDIVYDPSPNTMTGDIATGFQVGEKWTNAKLPDGSPDLVKRAADVERKRVKLWKGNRIHIKGIHDGPNPLDPTKGWQPDDYWNGDGGTGEESIEEVDLDNLFMEIITDGAVDLKCKGKIGFLRAEATRGTKFWNTMHLRRLLSLDPVLQGGIGGCTHLRVQGNNKNPPVITIDQFYGAGNKQFVDIENGPVQLNVVGHFEGPSFVRLNNGGSLMPGSTWNGSAFPK